MLGLIRLFWRRKSQVGRPRAQAEVRRLIREMASDNPIGTIRRELFGHVIVSGERHARRLLRGFQVWYNEDRLHLALEKDAPDHRPV